MADILKSLQFNGVVFVGQIVLFLALWAIMNVIFWKPVMAHLKGREQKVDDAYKSVEDTRKEMENLRAEYQARIAQVEADARARIQNAIKEAQTERERAISEARAHSDETLRQGIADMEREKVEALNALRERMVGLAVNAVGKAFGPAADPVALRRSIEERIANGTNGANPALN